MMAFMNACKKAALIRSRHEKTGEHIPSFSYQVFQATVIFTVRMLFKSKQRMF
jgi:hypothetical protein